MSRRLLVLSAGLSTPSSTRLLADRIADAVRSQVGARGEAIDVETVELREIAVPLASMLVTGGMPTPEVDAVREAVSAADGVVVVTPVYAASYSGLFKMFVDTLDPDGLTGTPVIIAATAGTARHSLVLEHALRPLMSWLRAVVVPTGVFAATDDFADDGLSARIQRAASELAALVVTDTAGVAGFLPGQAPRRRSGVGVEHEVTPFAQLLREVDPRGQSTTAG